jgi:dethiobiotin synthetase
MKAYFITATDTDAGKTFVSAGLLHSWSKQGYKTLGFKPIASGCQKTNALDDDGLRNEDAQALINAANVSLDYKIINPYTFEPAIAPHIAAQQVGIIINLESIVENILPYQSKVDYLLVEGVGGWQVPLNDQQSVSDLARMLNFPIILVVNLRLGCINHALLTVQSIEQQGLKLAGWIANHASTDNQMSHQVENIHSLQDRIHAPFLGELPHLSGSDKEKKDKFAHFIDLEKCI